MSEGSLQCRKHDPRLGGHMASCIRRREFIAQPQSMPVIGFLNLSSPGPSALFVTGFGPSLKEAAYVEGQNLAIEYRWAVDRTVPEYINQFNEIDGNSLAQTNVQASLENRSQRRFCDSARPSNSPPPDASSRAGVKCGNHQDRARERLGAGADARSGRAGSRCGPAARTLW
jgi:hypothetical protein